MALTRGVLAGVIVTALVSISALAAWGAVPAENAVADEILIVSGFRIEIATEILSVDVSGDSITRAPLQSGQSTRVDSFFDISYAVSHKGKNATGSFRVDSFFDVFFDAVPTDPATGRDGSMTAKLSGMLDLPAVQSVVDLDPCVIVESVFELGDEVAAGRQTFTARSFSHILMSAVDPATGAELLDYGEMTEDTTSLFTTKAGTTAQVDSFFDVFFDVFTDPATPGGGGTSHSFFDISYAVFEPNDEPLLQVAGDGSVKVGAHLRPGHGDAELQVRNSQSQRIEVMFNPKEYTLGKTNRFNENTAITDGTSNVPVDSFFDVFFKVQPQPEPPRPASSAFRQDGVLGIVTELGDDPAGLEPCINVVLTGRTALPPSPIGEP